MVHVFHHIPKAAGTSCMGVLSQWFTLVKDYRAGLPQDAPEAYGPKVDVGGLDGSQMLCGHWEYRGYRLFERYPELAGREDVRIITFLRDPVETAASMFHYGRTRNGTHIGKMIDEHVAQCPDWLTYIFGCEPGEIERHLDRYWFVGVTERLQDSLDALADRLGKARVRVAHENATPRRGPGPSAEAVRAFEARCPAWFGAYRYAVRRFEAMLSQVQGASP